MNSMDPDAPGELLLDIALKQPLKRHRICPAHPLHDITVEHARSTSGAAWRGKHGSGACTWIDDVPQRGLACAQLESNQSAGAARPAAARRDPAGGAREPQPSARPEVASSRMGIRSELLCFSAPLLLPTCCSSSSPPRPPRPPRPDRPHPPLCLRALARPFHGIGSDLCPISLAFLAGCCPF